MNDQNKQDPPFPTPNVAVDAVLFSIQHETLHVLMIQIKSGFYANAWALPGGLVRIDETLEWAAKRVLFEKTQVKDVYLEQLYAFGDLDRDPRSRTISVAYYALVDAPNKYKIHEGTYYKDIEWFPVRTLPDEIAFDHRNITQMAHKTLKERIMNSDIAASLLSEKFTFSKLQRVYEAILGEELDKRNFRKRMLALELVQKTGDKEEGRPHRPAWLYEFTP
jgi:8-oxo-dGTP diphosphatase